MKMEAGGTKRGVLAAALAALLPVAAAADDQTVVARDGDAIVYSGAITQQGNARVEALLAAGEGIEWLRITSVGGEVNLGMDLGDLVRGHGLDVEVVDYCASSCANYVFPAGRRKLLPPDSVVVWHGSAIQSGIGALANIDFAPMEAHLGRTLSDEEKAAAAEEMGLTAYFDGLTRRQAEFYAAIGVDERVTVFGQALDCDCDWTIPVEDMTRFGITGIEAPQGYGSHLRPMGREVMLLRLDDYPRYAEGIDATRAGAEGVSR